MSFNNKKDQTVVNINIYGNKVRKSKNANAQIKLPSGTFRSLPYVKEFNRVGKDRENYYFQFHIYNEYNYLDDGNGGRNDYGYFIHIINAPYLNYALDRLHEFHIIHGTFENHICWNKPIQSFEEANAVMYVWVKLYSKLIDVLKENRTISSNELIRKADNRGMLPTGTFRSIDKTNNKKSIYICEKVYNEIMDNLSVNKPELGGMLGYSNNQDTIDNYVFDSNASVNEVEYNPNTEFLQEVLDNDWQNNNIKLAGFVHSHPADFNKLSNADVEYALRIIKAFDMEYMFMPIVTSSFEFESTITGYIVYATGKVNKCNIEVIKDELLEKDDKEEEMFNLEDNILDQELENSIEEQFNNMNNINSDNDNRVLNEAVTIPQSLETKVRNDQIELSLASYLRCILDKKGIDIEKTCGLNIDFKHVHYNITDSEYEVICKLIQNTYGISDAKYNACIKKIANSTDSEKDDQFRKLLSYCNTPERLEKIFKRVSNVLDIKYLLDCTVIGIGCGGSRSFYESMARMGVGNFILMDGDHITYSNVASQNAYISELGLSKTKVIKSHIKDINPYSDVECFNFYLTSKFSDKDFETKILSNINTKHTLLCAFTDDFYAQARTSKLSQKYHIPFIAAQHHAKGETSELVFYYPGVTKYTLEDICKSRYEDYKNGYENDVTSDSSPIFNTTRLNAICEKVAIGMLLYDKYPTHEYCNFLQSKKDENLILVRQKTIPNNSLNQLFSDSNGYLFDDTVFVSPLTVEPDLIDKPNEEKIVTNSIAIF